MNLNQIIRLERKVEIVDIGANPIDGDPPYKSLLDANLANVTGFEPQREAFLRLQQMKSSSERYFEKAIGDGSKKQLNVCRASGMTSFFEPDPNSLRLFDVLRPLAEIVEKVEIDTTRLNDISEIKTIDFLKIDIQGGELDVISSASGPHGKLRDAAVIQAEVSFIALYKDQPTFGEFDVELRRMGFIPHCFAALKKWPISPLVVNNNPRQALNQLLEADIVYVKDFTQPENVTDEQLKMICSIAHWCYKSFDLALHCIAILEKRGAIPLNSQRHYLALFQKR